MGGKLDDLSDRASRQPIEGFDRSSLLSVLLGRGISSGYFRFGRFRKSGQERERERGKRFWRGIGLQKNGTRSDN